MNSAKDAAHISPEVRAAISIGDLSLASLKAIISYRFTLLYTFTDITMLGSMQGQYLPKLLR